MIKIINQMIEEVYKEDLDAVCQRKYLNELKQTFGIDTTDLSSPWSDTIRLYSLREQRDES